MKEYADASARYARALFDAAAKSREEAAVQEDLEGLVAVMKSSGLENFLQSPRPSPADKRKAVARVASMLRAKVSGSFLQLLLRKSRLAVLPGVLADYTALWRTSRGIIRAELFTAVAPVESFTKKVAETLARITGKTIDLVVRQDPKLTGGFVVKMQNDLIDESVKTRLETLKKQLLETSIN